MARLAVNVPSSSAISSTSIEQGLPGQPAQVTSGSIDQAGICVAVAWHFARQMVPDVVDAGRYRRLDAFSAQAEYFPGFRAAPFGAGTFPVAVGT